MAGSPDPGRRPDRGTVSECIVYRIEGGRVAESTVYVNWLDPYVQMALVDMCTLTS